MPQVFSFKIQKLMPDSRQEQNPNGNHEVDSELIKEWTNQVMELDSDDDLQIDEIKEISLCDIAEFFFDSWTDETGWLFHLLEVELPANLKYLLSEDKNENQRENKWFFPGMFCSRSQVVQFF